MDRELLIDIIARLGKTDKDLAVAVVDYILNHLKTIPADLLPKELENLSGRASRLVAVNKKGHILGATAKSDSKEKTNIPPPMIKKFID